MNDTATTCTCGQPTRDAAYFCDTCAASLTQALFEIPWLDDELDTTITRQKAATYNGHSSRGAETPSPVHWGASEARTHLKAVLVSWVRFCADTGITNASPHRGLPADELPAISRWLLWRVDGLALHDIGPDAVDEITAAVGKCRRLIDRPADKQYLGPCDVCDTGKLYARPGGTWARCDTCEAKGDADAIRNRMLAELDDRLCTAAEIAHLSTYLGLQANRDQVRKRINQWHRRERIHAEHAFSADPVFRFGIVWRLLAQDDEVKAG